MTTFCNQCQQPKNTFDLLVGNLCPDCAEIDHTRLRLWFECGEQPIKTIGDMDDFLTGACIVFQSPLPMASPQLQRDFFGKLPEQYVGIRSSDWNSFAFGLEIKRPIPADVMRKAVHDVVDTIANPQE